MAHADVEHERRAGGGDAGNQPAVERLQGVERELAVEGMLRFGHEAALLLVLAAEGLDQGDGGEDALDDGVDLGFLEVRLGGQVADLARNPGDGDKKQRNDAQGVERQLRVHAQADHEHADQQRGAGQRREHAVHEQRLHGVGVAHDAVVEVARGRVLVEAQGLALEMVEQVAAQVLDHILAHADGQVVVAQLHEADQEMHADQHAHHGGELDADRDGFEVRLPAEDVQGLVADDLVHGQGQRPGLEQLHGAGQADQGKAQQEVILVGFEVPQQRAKHAHGASPCGAGPAPGRLAPVPPQGRKKP